MSSRFARPSRALACLLMLLLGVSAGIFPAAAPRAAAQANDQLILGSLEEPGSLSALVDLPHHFPEHVPQTFIFDSLTQYMPDGSVAPKLADTWEGSADGLSWTFRLNGNAKWHDGWPVTADDVVFTFNAMLDPRTGSSDEGVDQVASVEALDSGTVRITLKQTNPPFLAAGGARGIVPKHVLEGQDIAKSDFNRMPVGSGPYRVAAYSPGSNIVFEANGEYFRGAPKIGRIIFKIIPDQNVMLTQLRSGEIQYALATPRDLRTIESLPGLKVYENRTYRFYDIAPNYQRDYFQDVSVRQALLAGINREAIVQGVLGGHGQVVDSFVTPISWAYNPDTPRHPYDKARAESLLRDAGYSQGADGILEKNGQKLAFTVMVNSFDRTLQQALTVAQQNLREIGVDMQIQPVEPGVFGSRRSKKEYDALSRIWNPVYDPEQTSLTVTGNFYGYSNPEADRLARAAMATTNQEERKRLYADLQVLLARDVARLWLYTENELHVLPANLGGVQPHPVNIFWNIKDWTLG